MNIQESIAKARLEIEINLKECCRELLDMNRSGILCDGHVRRITSIITGNNQHQISYHDASGIVFSSIHEQAMMVCVWGEDAI